MSVLHTVAQAVTDHIDIWAAPEPTGTPQPTGAINTTGILGWFAKYPIPIIIGAISVVTAGRAMRGNMSQTMNTSIVMIVSLVMLASAGVLFMFGQNIVNVIFGG
jgi:hypothetical protein